MRYPCPLVQGVFLRRYKRFLVDVALPDGEVTAHLANTGSMRSCLQDSAPVRLSWSSSPKRKLPWSVEQICVDGRWICVNTSRPNQVVAEALAAKRIPALDSFTEVRREVKCGQSRLDFRLERPADGAVLWLEVKNATLRRGDGVVFPDSVTARGLRHVEELVNLVGQGFRAVLFFHVGGEGVTQAGLADDLDPAYATALRAAAALGVEVMAWRAAMTYRDIWLECPVRVAL